MIEIIIGFFVNILEKIGFGWWKKYEDNEVQNAANKVDSLSDADVSKRLHKWERD